MNCTICKKVCLNSVLDLGEVYPSGFLSNGDALPAKSKLHLLQCDNCGLVRLETIIDQDNCYRQYWYRSSLNPSMIKSLQDVVIGIEKRIKLKDHDVVIDIGCNDGSLFGLYSNKNLFKVGFDPALNLKKMAGKNCNVFVNDYYSTYKEPVYLGVGENPWFFQSVKAKVITAIAMFYDLEDPHTFLECVKENLSIDGIFVIQMTDLYSMFKVNAFDNICHEHLQVYSLKVLNNLLNSHGLEIFDVEYNDVNGGSLRTYIRFRGECNSSSVLNDALANEDCFFSKTENKFSEFKKRIDKFKDIVVKFIKNQITQGKKIFIMGASTKGNTLLQYFGIDSTLIPYAAEVNSEKFGLKTIGTNIEIISEDVALELKPDIFLVLPWHFRESIIKNNTEYLAAGGALLFPLPIPQIVTKNEVIELGD